MRLGYDKKVKGIFTEFGLLLFNVIYFLGTYHVLLRALVPLFWVRAWKSFVIDIWGNSGHNGSTFQPCGVSRRDGKVNASDVFTLDFELDLLELINILLAFIKYNFKVQMHICLWNTDDVL